MSKYLHAIACVLAIAAYAAAVPADPARAAETVRYIGTAGNNTNPCTLVAPCRTLQRGIDRTPAGGELHLLDSGTFGSAATIDKSMTIVGGGQTVMGSGIIISGGGLIVVLRDLSINGDGASAQGVDIGTVSSVHLERCVVSNFQGHGVRFSGTGDLFISNSTIRNNDGFGLSASGNNGTRVTVDAARFEANNLGIFLNVVQATIDRSTIAGNATAGLSIAGGRVNVTSTTSAHNGNSGFIVNPGLLTLESSVSRANTLSGLAVGSGSTGRISNSVFTDNSVGINNSGTVLSRKNNTVSGNTTDLAGNALTTLTAQ